MAHLKRYLIPKYWPMPKKVKIFAVRPGPGPHSGSRCIPLLVAVRDVLHYADSSKEARKIINDGKILVDRKVKKDSRYSLGLMDILEIPEIKKCFRLGVNRKGLALEETGPEESSRKTCRIEGKTTIKGGITQLNLHDGRNILVKGSVPYMCGDSLLIQLPEQGILKHLRLGRGSEVFIIGGKNIGLKGRIKSIRKRKNMLEKSTAILESGGKEVKTLLDYIFVTGSEAKPRARKEEKAKDSREKK